MTDHKFTDDEIIKALECCAEAEYCATCLATDSCKGMDSLMENALTLINRQKAEIERLKKIGDYKTSEVLRHDASIRELHKQLETAKSEAIKEFAERLVAIYENDKTYDRPNAHTLVVTVFRNIDTLVKEMTEGNHESQST